MVSGSHPQMTERIIRRHVPEWPERLDFSTLDKLPTELIGDKLLPIVTCTMAARRLTSAYCPGARTLADVPRIAA